MYGKEHVLSVSGEYGVINQIELLGRSYAGVSVLDYHVVDTGDIVYTKSPLKTNPYGIIKANLGPSGIVSTLYAVYKVSPEHSSKYWNAYFCLDDRTNKYLLPLVHKGAKNDMKINNDRVLIDPVSSPSLSEQRKIAEFLEAVDERIAQVTRKQALLEDYKKGCMQQLFSQSIRFKDDQGNDFPDWEEKRLGDVAQFSKGKGISKADIEQDGENLCIRYGELYTEYREYIPEVVSRTDTSLKGAVLSRKNDVLMPTSDVTPSGLATASAIDTDGVILGGDILIIRSKKILNRFFAYFIAANKLKIMRLVSGVTVYHIYGSDLATLHLEIPHPDEQEKIADFLSAIDNKIDLVTRELTQARSFKAGLLQQMFV